MKILLINAQAVNTAYNDIVNTVNSQDVDIVCINETFQDAEKKLKFLNWKVYDKPRIGRKGGGVAICIKENSKCVAVECIDYESTEQESVAVNIITDKGTKLCLLIVPIHPT